MRLWRGEGGRGGLEWEGGRAAGPAGRTGQRAANDRRFCRSALLPHQLPSSNLTGKKILYRVFRKNL